jgi:RNA-directed DNA polymerase
VDATTRTQVERTIGVESFLEDLRSSLKDGSFRPLPVRRTEIPKKGGKARALGIPTVSA